jgi:tetratricopeptide (TPR) repeat protein
MGRGAALLAGTTGLAACAGLGGGSGPPDDLGRGIALYREGEYAEAAEALDRAVAARPDGALGRLYLALAHIRKKDAFQAEEHLTALRGLRLDPRLATQIDLALDVIRKEPLTPPIRAFLAGSLELQADLFRELGRARQDARSPRGYAAPTSCVKRGSVLLCY